MAALALRVVSFERLVHLYVRNPKTRLAVSPSAQAGEVGRLALFMTVASRHSLFPVTCLTQALSYYWLLGQRGIPATLRIGVARQHGLMTAHAWVEHQDQILLGAPPVEHTFTPLFTASIAAPSVASPRAGEIS